MRAADLISESKREAEEPYNGLAASLLYSVASNQGECLYENLIKKLWEDYFPKAILYDHLHGNV